MPDKIKTIAVIISGGNSAGMDQWIDEIVQGAATIGVKCLGITQGTLGLTKNHARGIIDLTPEGMKKYLDDHKNSAGAILQPWSDRYEYTPQDLANMNHWVRDKGIDAYVCLGGDGSSIIVPGLFEKAGVPRPGLLGPKTMDDDVTDVWGSSGHDSSSDFSAEALDNIAMNYAYPHNRLLFCDHMGRECGSPVVHTAIKSKYVNIALLPEVGIRVDTLVAVLEMLQDYQSYGLISVAEGLPGLDGENGHQHRDDQHKAHTKDGAKRVVNYLTKHYSHVLNPTNLKHMEISYFQRGLPATSDFDQEIVRNIAKRMIALLGKGQMDMAILNKGYKLLNHPVEFTTVPLEEFRKKVEAERIARKDGHGRDAFTCWNLNELRDMAYERGIVFCDESPEEAVRIALRRAENPLYKYFRPATSGYDIKRTLAAASPI